MPSIKNLAKGTSRFVESNTFFKLTVGWFVLQAIFMAISTQYAIPPDERYHFNLIKLFDQSGWLPILHDQSGYYFLSEVVRSPFTLYHYLLSLPAHFFINLPHNLFGLRLFNIGLGVISLYLTARLADRLRLPAAAKNLSLFMLANTLMFLFLSASVSYDNLLIPLALVSLVLMFDLLKKFQTSTLLLLALALLAGLLTAIKFIPIAVAIGLVITCKILASPQLFISNVRKTWPKSRWFHVTVTAPLLIVLAIFFQHYVLNLARYHTYSPSFRQVNPALCVNNYNYPCVEIPRGQPSTQPLKSIFNYLPAWGSSMISGTYGIEGHKYANSPQFMSMFSRLLIVLAVLAFIVKFSLRDRRIALVAGISGFYVVALIFTNFRTYRDSRVLELGLQSRYLFVILPALYLIGNHYILRLLRSSYLQGVYLTACLVIFLFAGLPSYILITNPAWHNNNTININSRLKQGLQHIIK